MATQVFPDGTGGEREMRKPREVLFGKFWRETFLQAEVSELRGEEGAVRSLSEAGPRVPVLYKGQFSEVHVLEG